MSAFFSRHRALLGFPIFSLLLFLAFALTACAPRETPVVTGNTTQTLHRGIGNDLADLDPHLATQAADYNVLSALLEGLVHRAVTGLTDDALSRMQGWTGDPRPLLADLLRQIARRLGEPSVIAVPAMILREAPQSPEIAAVYRAEVLDRMMPPMTALKTA